MRSRSTKPPTDVLMRRTSSVVRASDDPGSHTHNNALNH